MRVSSEMFYTAEPFYKEPTQHCPTFFSKAHAISIPISYFLWVDYLSLPGISAVEKLLASSRNGPR